MHIKICLALLTAFLGIVGCYAQKVKTVHGEYIYHAPENVSIEEARRIALERAKIQALGDEFGTLVTQHNSTYVNNVDGKTTTDFSSLSGSDVKGEWIETTSDPSYNISYEQGMLVVKCTVEGKAREITSAGIELMAKVLKNGVDDCQESNTFKNGDNLYLAFQSPAKGYLAVYLVTPSNKAYCLLPYQSSTEGVVSVNANKRYVFFSQEEAEASEKDAVDEYTMTCDNAAETNFIHIIFSPHQFVKPLDNSVDGLPRELSFDNFQKWTAKNKTKDPLMQVSVKSITITP